MRGGGEDRNTIRFREKGALAAVEQGSISAANFTLNLVLVRMLPLESFGAFAVGFAVLQVTQLAYSSCVVEPVMIRDPFPSRPQLLSYVATLEWITVKFVGVVGGASIAMLALVAGSSQGYLFETATGVALILIPHLTSLLVRRAGYVANCHGAVALGGIAYAGTMLGTLLALWFGLVQPTVLGAFLTLGGCSAVCVAVVSWGLWAGQPRRPVRVTADWPHHFAFAKWALPAAAVGFVPGGIYSFLLPAMLDLSEVGRFRAVLNLSVPGTQLVAVMGQVLIPEFGRRRKHPALRQFAIRLWAVGGVAVLALGLIVLIFGREILELVYGSGKVVVTWSDILAVSVLPTTYLQVAFFGSVVKAVRHPRALLIGSAVGALCSLTVGIILVAVLGATGALWGSTLAYTMWGLALVVLSGLFLQTESRRRLAR